MAKDFLGRGGMNQSKARFMPTLNRVAVATLVYGCLHMESNHDQRIKSPLLYH